MVKFVGGPSVNAYKNYRNHTIARPGQFRMPRNYGSVTNKTTIIVRNYNQCNCGPKMNWLAAMPMFGDLLKGIFDLFKKPEPVVKPKVEETVIKPKEETVIKTEKPEKTEKPVTPTPIIEGNIFSDEKVEGGKEAEVLTIEVKDEEMDRIQVPENKRKLTLKEGETEYMAPLWGTVTSSYKDENGNSIANTKEFRNWFRTEILGNKNADIYDLGNDQHFPKEITFNGKKYSFDREYFVNQENWDHYKVKTGTGAVNYANMDKKETEAEAGTKKETWTASTSFKLDANKDGDYDDAGDIKLSFDATSTVSADDVKKQLKDKINNSTLTADQKASTIAHLGTLTVTKKNQ